MTCSQVSGGGKGERPVGVPAAHGHWGDGGADIRGTLGSPEHDRVCRPGVGTSIGRSAHLGSVRKYSKGGSREFRFGCGGGVKNATQCAQTNGGEKCEKGRDSYPPSAKRREKTAQRALKERWRAGRGLNGGAGGGRLAAAVASTSRADVR